MLFVDTYEPPGRRRPASCAEAGVLDERDARARGIRVQRARSRRVGAGQPASENVDVAPAP
jgi:hypothetical protein